jgi:hypothetical protein
MRRSLPVFVLALCLASCGGVTRTSSGPEAFGAQLQITVWPQGASSLHVIFSLHCPAGAASSASEHAACARLSRLNESSFAPVPRETICAQVYGGPQTAHVKGTIEGEPVEAFFNRGNGCEIARWEALGFLFRLGPST